MRALVDDIEWVLLRAIVERGALCREAAQDVIKLLESRKKENAR